LTGEEARRRVTQYVATLLKPKKRTTALSLLISQFKSPIILILIFASTLSFFPRNPVDAVIISAIVFVSGLLGFWQERGATNAIDKLLSIVQITAAPLVANTPVDVTPQIATRVYELHEHRGRSEGQAVQDWLEAEREIRKDESPN
jgi:Mg2+-importing ATPase